ncbi:MAG TPA: type II toxin-antitoxin system RelE/ParE family toxin [Terriglobales bacterium]|nr:type II toxin-antitoxin system RelE/ParE family toxin [Terriglobales bacterium]HTT21703.1 type II toxin-antitoxin system RelE/ParE family toxin [Candidatus Sulfotelmatobacter sp.]
MKRFEVLLTEDAARDLDEIYDYVAEREGLSRASHVLDRVEQLVKNLAEFPERGAHPKELVSLGIRDYRQIFFKPYRVIYRVVGQRVYVYLIVDGRRDMQTVLARRLLEE